MRNFIRLKFKKKNILVFSFCLVLMLSSLMVYTGMASSTSPEPGSDEDPLITKSYIDAELIRFSEEINSKISKLTSDLNKNSKSDEAVDALAVKLFELAKEVNELEKQVNELSKFIKYEVVELEAGQKMILGDSTEIILRGGKALAISGENGDGLADVTTDRADNDLKTDNTVPLNHLILVSRDDGRGIKALSKSWVLVKGNYTIENSENNSEEVKETEAIKQ